MATQHLANTLGEAHALARAGNPRGASEAFEAVIALQPEALEAHRALAALALKHGGAERCAQVLARAAQMMPGNCWAQREYGRLLCALKKFGEAVAPLRAAARLSPEDAALHYDLGVALQESGQIPDAITAYRRALALAADLRTHHNLASALQASGDMAAALREYARAFALDPACLPRIAQDLAAGRCGRVWLNVEGLKQALRQT